MVYIYQLIHAIVFHACLHIILSEIVVLPFMWLFHIHSGILDHWMEITSTCRQMWSSYLGCHKMIYWPTTKLSSSSHMEVSTVSLAPISEYRKALLSWLYKVYKYWFIWSMRTVFDMACKSPLEIQIWILSKWYLDYTDSSYLRQGPTISTVSGFTKFEEFPDVQNISSLPLINPCREKKITVFFDFSHPSIRNQLPPQLY